MNDRDAVDMSLLMQEHYLTGELDADRNDRCVCGFRTGDPSVVPGWDDHLAEVLVTAGWRRSTVTPEQLLAVVQILDDVPAVRFPETWMRKARDIARAFRLEVPSE